MKPIPTLPPPNHSPVGPACCLSSNSNIGQEEEILLLLSLRRIDTFQFVHFSPIGGGLTDSSPGSSHISLFSPPGLLERYLRLSGRVSLSLLFSSIAREGEGGDDLITHLAFFPPQKPTKLQITCGHQRKIFNRNLVFWWNYLANFRQERNKLRIRFSSKYGLLLS